MTHSELELAFIGALTTIMGDHGLSDVPLVRSDQYGKAGRIDAGLYYSIGAPQNHGWQGRRYKIRGDNAGHRELAHKRVVVRITSIVDERTVEAKDSFAFDEHRENFEHPFGTPSMNASELADTARMIVASLPFVEQLRKYGVGGVERATEPTDSIVQNEKDDYEREVTFTVALTYTKTLTPSTRVITALQPRIERV